MWCEIKSQLQYSKDMDIYAQSLIVLIVLYGLAYVWALAQKNNSIVLGMRGIGVIAVASVGLIHVGDILDVSPHLTWKDRLPFFVILALTAVWAVRLSGHLTARSLGMPEDFRFADLRKNWGEWAEIRMFLQVFLLEAVTTWAIALPIMFTAIHDNAGMLRLIYAGIAIWIIGFLIETISDQQLKRFKRKPENKGKIMSSGLWKYSRHPNYFGEVLIWWGIFIIALSSRPPELWLISSPLLVTFLLRYVTGVPAIESRYKDNKAYQQYKAKTPAILPKVL